MIQHQHGGADGFTVAVQISGPPMQRLSRLEKLVIRLGGPDRVDGFANASNLAVCGLTLAYLVLWFFWLHGVVTRTLNPSFAGVMFLTAAWVPLMLFQVFINFLRLACFTLRVKGAEQIASAAGAAFFEAVNHCVTETVERYMATREMAEEKPTLQ